MTFKQAIDVARRVPRYARERQGFRDIHDFAAHIREVRARRAELRQPPGPILPDSACDRLCAALMSAPSWLREEARLAAHCSRKCRAPIHVESRSWGTPLSSASRLPYCEGRSGWTDWRNGRPRRYHRSTLVIVIPTTWLVPRLSRLRRRSRRFIGGADT